MTIEKAVAGSIIYLNGASSAGKTSIAKELQQILAEPYLYIGLDTFIMMLPNGYSGAIPNSGFTFSRNEEGVEVAIGPVAQKLLNGMGDTIAALAATGNNVIVDDVIWKTEILKNRVKALEAFKVWFIGICCPGEVATIREQQRGDRFPGLAEYQTGLVHQHGIYDFEVDTSFYTSRECALRIKAFVENEYSPTAFKQLASQYSARD